MAQVAGAPGDQLRGASVPDYSGQLRSQLRLRRHWARSSRQMLGADQHRLQGAPLVVQRARPHRQGAPGDVPHLTCESHHDSYAASSEWP
jgi:hypothetical protein